MKKILYILIILLFVLSGCTWLTQQAADPNSGMNNGLHAVQAGANITTTVAPLFGGWGPLIGMIGSAVAGGIGVYFERRKKISVVNTKVANLTTAATTIIGVIEKVGQTPLQDGNTLGDLVKSRVKTELEGKQWYMEGKQLITTLKASLPKPNGTP